MPSEEVPIIYLASPCPSPNKTHTVVHCSTDQKNGQRGTLHNQWLLVISTGTHQIAMTLFKVFLSPISIMSRVHWLARGGDCLVIQKSHVSLLKGSTCLFRKEIIKNSKSILFPVRMLWIMYQFNSVFFVCFLMRQTNGPLAFTNQCHFLFFQLTHLLYAFIEF